MALIKTINEWRKVVRMVSELKDEALPKTELVEKQYLLPVMGAALLAELQTAYNNNSLSTKQSELLALCQGVIAPLAWVHELPLLQTQLGNGGLVVNETENNPRPFKWQYNEVVDALRGKAWEYFELLITYLRQEKATFTTWSSSPYNSAQGFCLIRDGEQLSELITVQYPHRIYWQLRPIFNKHCSEFIIKNLGREYYTALNNKCIAGSVTANGAEEVYVLKPLQKACAQYAMKYAAIELSLQFSEAGFTIADSIKDTPQDGRTAASDAQLNTFKAEMEMSAMSFMDDVRTYLNANATAENDFSAYFGSSFYTDPTAATKTVNNDRAGFFYAG